MYEFYCNQSIDYPCKYYLWLSITFNRSIERTVFYYCSYYNSYIEIWKDERDTILLNRYNINTIIRHKYTYDTGLISLCKENH